MKRFICGAALLCALLLALCPAAALCEGMLGVTVKYTPEPTQEPSPKATAVIIAARPSSEPPVTQEEAGAAQLGERILMRGMEGEDVKIVQRRLYELGYYLGKFIYLCDCFEDIERDIKKNNYNPLLSRSGGETFDADCEQMLSDMMARAALAFERLPLLEDAEIMRNILYSGVWLRVENALARRKAKEKT